MSVNTHDLLALADHLDRVHRAKTGFDMAFFFKDQDGNKAMAHVQQDSTYECHAPSCIAGHYLAMKGVHVFEVGQRLGQLAAEMLNISEEDRYSLFIPSSTSEYDPYTATAAQAAWLIREYANTGEINWKEALEQ